LLLIDPQEAEQTMTDEAQADNVSVAEFIDEVMEDLGITDRKMATLLSYGSPNIIKMFREGRVKVPLEKIPDFADAIGTERAGLMNRALREYLPDVAKSLSRCYGELTDNEIAIINYIQEVSGDSDPGLDERLRSALLQAFSVSAPTPE
jgi:hypothetical protein